MNSDMLLSPAALPLQLNHLEIIRVLWIAFPAVPLTAVACCMLGKYLFRREWTLHLIRISHILQILAAVTVTWLGLGITDDHYFVLQESPVSIAYLFSREKLLFLWAYMPPLILSLFRLKSLGTFQMQTVFLFYLAGCSGLIVTGDAFNFFVYYELMIMGAYVLISVKQEYIASVKYMVFGAASSAMFLGAIVLLYSSGAYFTFDFAHQQPELPIYTITASLLLFACAFFVKGAFFPVSGWVAPCHSAANSLVSAFLASFTIFTGILGMYYMVLLPAEALGLDSFFLLVRVLSVLTVIGGSLILFWERSLKRCIAASTVFTIGLAGLLCSYQLYLPAMLYVLIHSSYKSLLFYLYEDLESRETEIRLHWASMLMLISAVLYAVGFTPSATGQLKSLFTADAAFWYKVLLLAAGGIIIGGFAKFQYRLSSRQFPSAPVITALLTAGAYTWVLMHLTGFSLPQALDMLAEAGTAVLALLAASSLFHRFPRLHNIDKLTIYRNLNQELLLVFTVVFASAAFLLAPW